VSVSIIDRMRDWGNAPRYGGSDAHERVESLAAELRARHNPGTTLTHADIVRAHDALSGMTPRERFGPMVVDAYGAWFQTADPDALRAIMDHDMRQAQIRAWREWERALVDQFCGFQHEGPAPEPAPIPRNEEFDAWRKRTAGVLKECAERKQ